LPPAAGAAAAGFDAAAVLDAVGAAVDAAAPNRPPLGAEVVVAAVLAGCVVVAGFGVPNRLPPMAGEEDAVDAAG